MWFKICMHKFELLVSDFCLALHKTSFFRKKLSKVSVRNVSCKHLKTYCILIFPGTGF